MDCQKLILYGVLLLVGIYVLKDVCGVKIPFIEGFDPNSESNGTVGEVNGVVPEVAAGLNGVGQPMSAEPPFEPPQMPPPVETAPPVPPLSLFDRLIMELVSSINKFTQEPVE